MSDCKFCKALNNWKDVERFDIEHPEFRMTKERIYREYNVALVIRSWVKGKKSTAGRTTDYRHMGIGFKLNYCPECGKKV